jgi:2-alkyl-3-oxoalkanoate reductase
VSGIDLVTGATGFIGRHMVLRLLARGRRVRALCRTGSEAKLPEDARARIELAFGDLTDRASLERAAAGASRVFHCAGEVLDWGPVDRFRDVNVRGTLWLLECARDAKVERFVHLSSFVVFGVPSPPVLDDASPYGQGSDPYTMTKTEGEKAVFAFHAETGLPVSVLRPTVVYGVGSTWLEEPMRMMKKGAFFLIGGGEGTCHPCYIENLLDAALLVAEHPRAVGHGYLVTDDDPISFRDYFAALASLSGASDPRRSIPVPVARAAAAGFEAVARVVKAKGRPLLTQTAIDLVTTKGRVSIQKIRDELGFVPRYRFRQAIEELRAGRTRRAQPPLGSAGGGSA